MKKKLILTLVFSQCLFGMQPQKSNEQLLVEAVKMGDLIQVTKLLESGANPGLVESLLCDALERHITFSRGQEKEQNLYEKNRNKVIELLLNDPRTHLNCKNSFGNTPLMHFVRLNNRLDTEKMLKIGKVDINAKNKQGLTALNFAESKDMQLLLENQGAVRGVLEQKISAFTPVRQKRKPAEPMNTLIFEFDVEPSAQLAQPTKQDLLVNAVKLSNPILVKKLLEEGANPGLVKNIFCLAYAQKPLDLTQRFETVKILALDKRTNLNCVDEKGFTVLMRAGYNTDDTTILFLTTTPGVKERIEVGRTNFTGQNASNYAKHTASKRAIQALEEEQGVVSEKILVKPKRNIEIMPKRAAPEPMETFTSEFMRLKPVAESETETEEEPVGKISKTSDPEI